MNAVVGAVALALAWLVLRARPDRRSRLHAIQVPQTGTATGGAQRAALVVLGVSAALAASLALRVQPPVLVAALCVAAVLRGFLRRRRQRRTCAAREAATVEAVFALAAELRAGQPPSRALALVAAGSRGLTEQLRIAATAVAAGASAGDELRRVAEEPGCGGLHGVAAAWDVTASLGGPVADVLDRLGEVLDAEQQSRTALSAAMSGSRATMLLLATLPAFGLALGQALGAQPLQLLLHRPLGWILLTAAVALDTVGVVWTGLIIRRSLR